MGHMSDFHIDNILRTYNAATRDEREAGMTWYDEQNALALELSPDDVWRGAGVISAFSPNTHWNQNVALARRLFANNGVMESGTLGRNIRNAVRIYNGEHTLDVLNGDKTRAFASAIANPVNSTIATIDRHAYDIAFGVLDTPNRSIGKRIFAELSDAYNDAAFWLGIGVCQVQAITWVAHRRIKGVQNATAA